MHLFIFEDMLYKKYKSVKDKGSELVFEEADTGRTFTFHHIQDCCENVQLVDIIGDLSDLEGSDLLEAEEISSDGPKPQMECNSECYVWTFYRFSTVKGSVTVRWAAEVPTYYSISVDFNDSAWCYPWDVAMETCKTYIKHREYI